MLLDTAMPCGKTSDRGDGGFKQFQFRVYRNIFPNISICWSGKHVRQLARSSQVSPNARRRAQCEGGGGKEKKYMYTKKCQTLYNLQASLRERRRNNYIQQKSRKHGKKESHRAAFPATTSQLPKALYLQNISNFVSQVCSGRPRGGYVGRGCHASVLLTQRLAGKFAM